MRYAFLLALGLLTTSFARAENPPLHYELNVPEAVRAQVVSDLAFAAGIEGGEGSPLHRFTFGAVSGPVYKDWFFSRIHYVGYDHFNTNNSVAFVQHFFDPEKMVRTQNFVNFSHPQIARVIILFHEARHSENDAGNWTHVGCPTPFLDEAGKEIRSIWTNASLSGQPACDTGVGGAYAISVIMNRNIARSCVNCTEKVRLDAELYAADQAKRIANPSARRRLDNDR